MEVFAKFPKIDAYFVIGELIPEAIPFYFLNLQPQLQRLSRLERFFKVDICLSSYLPPMYVDKHIFSLQVSI
jgi:hypothetical protein